MEQLIKLYSFESVYQTPDEAAIADYICEEIEKAGGSYMREGNNIYNFHDKEKPILSAHLDQVETNGKAVHFAQDDKGIIKAWNEKWQRTSLGADDKNGVWIILQLIKKYPNLNYIISSGEERGCIGINHLDKENVLAENISDKQFCIVLDRRGGTDVLSGGGASTYCKTLAQDICNYLGDDRLTVTTGSLSDTATICKYCESVNMSVAYDSPHTAKETTDFNRLNDILNYVDRLVSGDFIHYSTKPSVYRTSSAVSTLYSTYYGSKGKSNGKTREQIKEDLWDDEYYGRWGY